MEVLLLLSFLVVVTALKSGHHSAGCCIGSLKPVLQTPASTLFMGRKLASVSYFSFITLPWAAGNKFPFHTFQRL